MSSSFRKDLEVGSETSSSATVGGNNVKFFFFLEMFLALCSMGISVYTFTAEAELVEFSNIFLGTLNVGFQFGWNFLLIGPLVSGITIFILSSAAIYAASLSPKDAQNLDKFLDNHTFHCSHSVCTRFCGSTAKGLFKVTLFLMIIMFIVQGALAGGYIGILQAIFASIDRNAVSTEPLTPFEADISTLQLTMFNLCCAEKGWSVHGPIEKCDTNGGPPPDCVVPADKEGFKDVLCTCYVSDSYQEFYNELAETRRVCEVLSNSVVEIDNQTPIPGTSLPIAGFIPSGIRRARIVGFNGTAEDDIFSKGEPKGYGCGFGGYAKAFQWMHFQYAEIRSLNIAIAMVIISVLEIVIFIAAWCVLQSNNDDEYFDQVAAQMRDIRKSRGANLTGAELAAATISAGKKKRPTPPKNIKHSLDAYVDVEGDQGQLQVEIPKKKSNNFHGKEDLISLECPPSPQV